MTDQTNPTDQPRLQQQVGALQRMEEQQQQQRQEGGYPMSALMSLVPEGVNPHEFFAPLLRSREAQADWNRLATGLE